MKTGSHLRIRQMGENVLGVELEGNPSRPEPIHFRLCLPGADIDVVRADDGTYWIHVHVAREDDGWAPHEDGTARFIAARLDCLGKASSEAVLGDFARADLYHVALRVAAGVAAVAEKPARKTKTEGAKRGKTKARDLFADATGGAT